MLTMTLVQNRTSSPMFAVHAAYERRGDKLQRVERRYRAVNGRWHCTSSKLAPWPTKDWTNTPNGERDKHGNRHTIKRDWLKVHAGLAAERAVISGVVASLEVV